METPIRVLLALGSGVDPRAIVRALHAGGFAPDWEQVTDGDDFRRTLERNRWDAVLVDDGFGAAAVRTLLATGEGSEGRPPCLLIVAPHAAAASAPSRVARVARDRLEDLGSTVRRALGSAGPRRDRRLAVQYAVTRVLADAGSVEVSIPRLLRPFCDVAGWAVAEFWTIDEAAQVLRMAHRVRRTGLEEAPERATTPARTWARGEAPLGRVWAERHPLAIGRTRTTDRKADPTGAPPPDCRGCAFPVVAGTQVTGVVALYSARRQRPRVDWLEFLGALGHQIGDLLERQRIDEARQESERRFAAFMQHLPGVAFMKTVDGRYVFVNETFERLFNRTRDEYAGKTDHDVWPPAVADTLRRNDETVARARQVLQTVEVIPHNDGLHEWLATKFPILDATGVPTLIGGIAIDITERKQAEAELQAMQKRAQERERLADIGAITAQIVHDLGNPLAGISMQVQLMLHRARRDAGLPLAAAIEPLERVLTEVSRLDQLIKEFMEFSREQRLELKDIDLERFVRQVGDLWRPVAAARGITLTVTVPTQAPRLIADEEKLHRVLDNLVKNAIEAIDSSPGRIDLTVEFPAPDTVRLSVSDTGSGIAESLQIFRLFETTKVHGSGIGLAVARQIVLAHRGQIEFANNPPRGTVFRVELPLLGPLG